MTSRRSSLTCRSLTRRRRRRLAAGALGALLLGTALSACSGSGASSGSSDVGSASGSSGSGSNSSFGGVADSAVAGAPQNAAGRADPAVQTRSVISTGSVDLRSGDVAAARLDVLRVLARYDGSVASEQTVSDPKAVLPPSPAPTPAASPAVTSSGPLTHTHLVLRVPSVHFDAAMTALSGVGDFVSSSRAATDVTTQVIDVAARLRVQRASVARIQVLLGRAQSIRDIVLVEAQLARRQAALESLQHQHAYLAGQTALATITVDVERTPTRAERKATAHAGFGTGISAGWHGLVALVAGVLTGLGALLPFLIVLVPLGLVAWLVRRLVVRRATGVVPDEMVGESP